MDARSGFGSSEGRSGNLPTCRPQSLGSRGAVGPTLPGSPGDRARPEVRRTPASARTFYDIKVGLIFWEEQPTVSGDAVLLKKTARAAP